MSLSGTNLSNSGLRASSPYKGLIRTVKEELNKTW